MVGIKAQKQKLSNKKSSENYSSFDQINGKHPLRNATTDCYIDYRVRHRKGGEVAFFNFSLAKEMGLLPKDHSNELNSDLEEKILETFSLVIINEYDHINDIEFSPDEIKSGDYMATRYLQLQHPNKQGKTSGDGRSIWNGSFKAKGKTWDISSCGTGATRLSPATHISSKFFQTGDPSISYGCGYSELDEALSTLFFSEVLHKNKIVTERVLGVIKFKNDIALAIRVHDNLLRPSHFFNHLRQNNLPALEGLVDYYINRQVKNKVWKDCPKTYKKKLDYFLLEEVEIFATMAANFEDEYIFCWLDWDGDNILMDGGIIDYGSVRQFGLFHSDYRYDDVDRFSTSILEQKKKAKYTCQTFIQLVDFLKTGKKKGIGSFKNSKELKKFDEIFAEVKDRNILKKIGLGVKHQDFLLKKFRRLVKEFRSHFTYFERTKSVEGPYEVADGINVNAVFCMRDILRELPQIYLTRGERVNKDEFIEILKSNYATELDLIHTPYRNRKINKFQDTYMKLIQACAKKFHVDEKKILLEVSMRSSIINKYDRITGDSITMIVDKLIKHRPRLNSTDLNTILNNFIEYQNLDPDTKKKTSDINTDTLVKNIFGIVRDFREGL